MPKSKSMRAMFAAIATALGYASAAALPQADVRWGEQNHPAITLVLGAASPCVWTYVRGWHRSGALGIWSGCQPGPEWRYERRCWIGPSNERHCRFYG